MTTAIETPFTAPPRAYRLASIDLVRGIVMVIMTLDHVRDFIHRGAMSDSPTNLATTTGLLFLTRWVTHVCAPTFALTAGLGAYLWWRQGRSRAALSRFLLARGLVLIGLELTAMQLAYGFSLSPSNPVFLLVLWSLGLSMVALAGLAWLPLRLLAPLSLAIIMLTPLLGGQAPADAGLPARLMQASHSVAAFQVGPTLVLAPYPLLPWVGVVTLGFCLGSLFDRDRPARLRALWLAAATSLAAFLVLRVLNHYGDPAPWSVQASPLFTALSFVNITKYPASPDFLLLTIALTLALLAGLDGAKIGEGRVGRAVVTLGRVPLFYYLAHFYMAHLIATILAFARYGAQAWRFAFTPYPSMGGQASAFPADFGHGLLTTYLVWAAVVALCLPLAFAYDRLKSGGRMRWLRFL